ncbi:MAG: hypothetical protein M5R42_13275 [Rhodocyclaceae bacterium]|nr:hypothetical protein [Rhodocyclaceae bacterium]
MIAEKSSGVSAFFSPRLGGFWRQVFVHVELVDVDIEAQRQRTEARQVQFRRDLALVELGVRMQGRRLSVDIGAHPSAQRQPDALHGHLRVGYIQLAVENRQLDGLLF